MNLIQRQLHTERVMRESPILRGWAEIGAFLKCSADTARDYARKHGMPVRKQNTRRDNDWIVAYKNELQTWFDGFTDRKPFRTDASLSAHPDAVRVQRYRLDVDAAVVRLRKLDRALRAGLSTPAQTLAAVQAIKRGLAAATLQHADGLQPGAYADRRQRPTSLASRRAVRQ